MTNIQAVVHVLPYLEAGGTERHVLHLIEGFRGHARIGVLSPPGPLKRAFLELGVTHVEFPRLEGKLFMAISAFRRGLRAMLTELRPSVIHVHAAPELALLARSVARRAGVPVVLTLHGFAVANPEFNFRIASTVARLARVEQIITVSEAEMNMLRRAGYPADRARVVYNGIPDVAGDQPVRWTEVDADRDAIPEVGGTVDWRRRCGWPPEAPVLGAVGRLEQVKGFDVLLGALARLPSSQGGVGDGLTSAAGRSCAGDLPRLVIVGDGSEREALERQGVALGLSDRLHFVGYMPDAHRAPSGFDIMVVPSRQEAFGIVAVEAMAAGTPVVASNVGGLPEAVLDGETGLIVPPDDAEGLAVALRTLLANPERAREMGRRGRQRFLDKFRVEVMVEHTWNVYHEVIR